jgi:hypothetical protein
LHDQSINQLIDRREDDDDDLFVGSMIWITVISNCDEMIANCWRTAQAGHLQAACR